MKENFLVLLIAKFMGVTNAILERVVTKKAGTTTTEEQATSSVERLTLSVGFKDENRDKAPDIIAFATMDNCRCDSNGVMKHASTNGEMCDYTYHIVYEGGKMDAGRSFRILEKERVGVEARGYDVLTGAALEAERLLNEW